MTDDPAAPAELLSDEEKARNLLNGQFGRGAELVHQAMRVDPVAKRIYDSAIVVMTSLIRSARENSESGR